MCNFTVKSDKILFLSLINLVGTVTCLQTCTNIYCLYCYKTILTEDKCILNLETLFLFNTWQHLLLIS